MKSTYNVFFYQTLMEPSIQRECFGHELVEGKDAELRGFIEVPYSHGYHDIERAGGKKVDGKVYEITAKDFIKAAEWEKEKYVPIGVVLSDGTDAVAFQFRSEHRREMAHARLTNRKGK